MSFNSFLNRGAPPKIGAPEAYVPIPYPKWITLPDGQKIVVDTEEAEHAALEAATAPVEAPDAKPEPAPERRPVLSLAPKE